MVALPEMYTLIHILAENYICIWKLGNFPFVCEIMFFMNKLGILFLLEVQNQF